MKKNIYDFPWVPHQMVMYDGGIRAFTPQVFTPWNAFIHVKAKEQNYFSPPPPLSDVSID